jgi:UDP-N-acetylglucosamine--N-acetylmuramyl-(pentapeptide) pyrophosphoryl-undecaprenol N-acetylglucosamine transferase
MLEPKTILIATGGTGGHIYPALVTGEEMRARGWNVLFVGSFGMGAKKVAARGFRYVSIKATGFVSRRWYEKVKAVYYMVIASIVCLGIVLRRRPDVVLGFGGYSSMPCVIAGRVLGIQCMLHEQNVHPGTANRVLGRFAAMIALSFRETAADFPGRSTVWTGCPVRLPGESKSRREVMERFGFEEGRKTILVFGGSQGSRAINECVISSLERGTITLPVQVIHLAGFGGAAGLKPRYAALKGPVFVEDYLDDMTDAYGIADCVIGRSGAGTVTELGLLGIPSILVPYPYAQSHQEANARVLMRNQAAEIIQEKDLNPDLLGAKLFMTLTQALPREVLRQKLAQDIAGNAVMRLADAVERL